MDTSYATRVAELIGMLPATGISRDLALQRLAEDCAAKEAMAALAAAADRARGTDGPLAQVLTACALADAPEFETPVERERRGAALSTPAFLALIPGWIRELREIAVGRPGTGACTIATGMQLWLWTMRHMKATGHIDIAASELADAFGPLHAARCRILELADTTVDAPTRDLLTDLCHLHAAHAAAAAGTVCAEIVFGYRRHLSWDAEGCATCYDAAELDELESVMPGIASGARAYGDVVERDGAHAAKAGPCAKFDGIETFTHLRARLDGCLTGARRAKDRAAAALPHVISKAPAGLLS